RGAAADQAHRRAREGGEEDLYPRSKVSAGRLRPGVRRVQGRQVVAHLRDDRCRPRGNGRCAGLAGGGFGRSVLAIRARIRRVLQRFRAAAATARRPHPDSMAFTNPLALPKSSLPAQPCLRAAITLPMSLMPVAPVASIACVTPAPPLPTSVGEDRP